MICPHCGQTVQQVSPPALKLVQEDTYVPWMGMPPPKPEQAVTATPGPEVVRP